MNIVLLGNKLSLYSGHSRAAWRIARHMQQTGHSARIVSSEMSLARSPHHEALLDSEGYHDLWRDRVGFPLGGLNGRNRRLRAVLEPILRKADILHVFDMRAMLAVSRMFGGRVPAKTVLHQVARPGLTLKDIYHSGIGGAVSALTRTADTTSLLAPRWFVARICRLADCIACSSQGLADTFAKTYSLDAASLRVILPGVDLPNEPDGQTDGGPDFLYFGWAGAHRGTLDAAAAFAKFLHLHKNDNAKPKCLVATFRRMRGLGEDFFTLLALQRYQSRGVQCDGFLPEIRTLLGGARAAVLPFRTQFGYALPPIAALEAMAAGTPVISTDLPAIREFITDGHNGLLVRPGDVNAITRKMQELWTDDGLYSRLSDAARRTVMEKFTNEQFLARIGQLYQQLA